MPQRATRRSFLALSGTGILLTACRNDERAGRAAGSSGTDLVSLSTSAPGHASAEPAALDVGATEDLMREHGVIRRVLVAYREAASQLRAAPAAVPLDALQRAAKLMRSFAEDYHERQLEEALVFPPLLKESGSLARTVGTLQRQHQRGRAITDYVLAVTARPIGGSGEALAGALEGFARMYEAHAAVEDTIVFPAWKRTLTAAQRREMGDRFEDIEHKAFGRDGFEAAVVEVGAVEQGLGIELEKLTAPPPP